MNSKSLVKLSNLIGTISIILLVYWVFIFISIEVFSFKVFRENLTDTFYMSILGILALMFGALIINIMFNLTRIADKHNIDNAKATTSRKVIGAFIISFPLIFGLLAGGDYLSSRKKEKMLINSAKSIVEDNRAKAEKLAAYSYDVTWLQECSRILTLFGKMDKYFPNVSLIVKDKIDDSDVYLSFGSQYSLLENDSVPVPKIRYILETTKVERDYLDKVFNDKLPDYRFSSRSGSYELFYPYISNNKVIVFYFSDYQRYGKIGS